MPLFLSLDIIYTYISLIIVVSNAFLLYIDDPVFWDRVLLSRSVPPPPPYLLRGLLEGEEWTVLESMQSNTHSLMAVKLFQQRDVSQITNFLSTVIKRKTWLTSVFGRYLSVTFISWY
jgi:hypothetical protein